MLHNIPGLRVVIPSSPARGYGLLLAAIRDPDPVVFLEPTRIYGTLREKVTDDGNALPLDRCFRLREGTDVTFVGWGAVVREMLAAAERLAGEGVEAEGIDVVTLVPLDSETILASVGKTERCVICHEAHLTGGFGAEIAAQLAGPGLLSLVAPVERVTGYDTIVPAVPPRATLHAECRANPRCRAAHPGSRQKDALVASNPEYVFAMPDLGEGLRDAEIVAWHVVEGDHVVADQPLVSVETDKAVVETPSPRSGRVARLLAAPHTRVTIGEPIAAFADQVAADAGTVVGELATASPAPRSRSCHVDRRSRCRDLARRSSRDGPPGRGTRRRLSRRACAQRFV